MKIVIFGANELGAKIASLFCAENDIILIDEEKNKSDLLNKLDVSFINGVASDIEVLKQANISDADIFISCTDFDEINIVACLTAKRLCDIRTMCFVKKEGYKASLGYAKDAEFNSDFYIDYVISQKELLTQEIFRILTVAKAIDVENFANGKVRLLEYKIADSSSLVNKAIKSCAFPKDTLIVGITRGEKLFIPNGETILINNDKVIFMGLSKALDMLAGKFFHEKGFIKNVTIIGGGSIGRELAKSLEVLKLNIKIIEKNYERCQFLSEQLESTLVINGDGTDIELLNEEDISGSDAVVSVTNNDEKNLLCSLMAKQLGVKRVITRVSKTTNVSLFERVGIDIALSPIMVSLNEVRNCLSDKSVNILTTVEQGKGEVLTINLSDNFKTQKIKEIKCPQKAIIGVIQRRNRVIIPNGETEIMSGDSLIIFTADESSQSVKEYFKVK